MIRTVAIVSLVLSAGAACAQTVELKIDIDQPDLLDGDSTRVTLIAEFSTGDYAAAGIMTDLVADVSGDPPGFWSDLQLVSPMDGPGTSAGELDGADGITGILAGQLNFPPAMIFADPSNPIAFWQATFTARSYSEGFLELSTSTSRLEMYASRDSTLSESRLDVLVEGTGRITINVPAPASGGLLLLGLGPTMRRRR